MVRRTGRLPRAQDHAAELRLNHGGGSWIGDSRVVHVNGDLEIRDVQGAKADILKWEPNLCQNCNNARSQPFDRAYMTLLGYLDQDEAEVGSTGVFRFADLYSDDWSAGRSNLIRYWLKHICCRVAVIGLEIPRAVVDYLDDVTDTAPPPHTALVLVVNDAVFRFQMEHGYGRGSGFGDADGYNLDGQLVAFESFVSWGWLALQYHFDTSDPRGWISFPDDLVEMGRVPDED
ncbi:hypothetical protein [Glaciibacter sp. 2TAF33]|uniref:hypothetical protein n=1 Tax=Glaciibacter sp. 2TAF33 TaxID=3233015 RepID=UPI003F8EFB57